MKIFVTGATGYVGSAIVRGLAESGHEVGGLTRAAGKSAFIEALGARPVVGDLRNAASYRSEAESADAVLHVAAEESGSHAEVDRIAVATLLEAAEAGNASALVYTSGCFVLGETGNEPADEDASTAGAPELVAWRVGHEDRVLRAGGPALSTAVVRPGMVYGGTDGAFASFFATAEAGGASEFVGSGTNRWSPVYRGDVARLYQMIVERQGRGIFHCAEPAERVEGLAAAASRAAGAGGSTRGVPIEEARKEMGAFADALTMDQVVGCARAREFGWAPQHPPFVESAGEVYEEYKTSEYRLQNTDHRPES